MTLRPRASTASSTTDRSRPLAQRAVDAEPARALPRITGQVVADTSQVTGYLAPGKTEQDVANFILKHVKTHGVELAWSAPDQREHDCRHQSPAGNGAEGVAGGHRTPW